MKYPIDFDIATNEYSEQFIHNTLYQLCIIGYLYAAPHQNNHTTYNAELVLRPRTRLPQTRHQRRRIV